MVCFSAFFSARVLFFEKASSAPATESSCRTRLWPKLLPFARLHPCVLHSFCLAALPRCHTTAPPSCHCDRQNKKLQWHLMGRRKMTTMVRLERGKAVAPYFCRCIFQRQRKELQQKQHTARAATVHTAHQCTNKQEGLWVPENVACKEQLVVVSVRPGTLRVYLWWKWLRVIAKIALNYWNERNEPTGKRQSK